MLWCDSETLRVELINREEKKKTKRQREKKQRGASSLLDNGLTFRAIVVVDVELAVSQVVEHVDEARAVAVDKYLVLGVLRESSAQEDAEHGPFFVEGGQRRAERLATDVEADKLSTAQRAG